MFSDKAEERIDAYVTELARLEQANEPVSLARRMMALLRLRGMELYWTTSRLLRQSEARLFPAYVERRNSIPAWKPLEAPGPESFPLPQPRLLLDMTSTLRSGKLTGIQRVVREIARHSWAMGAGVPVAIHNGRLFAAYRRPDMPPIVEIEDGDIFLMLDASWNHTEEYLPILDKVRAKGGKNIVCLYDILPLIYPAAFPHALTERFEGWLSSIVLQSDGVIADSRAAAESLRDYLARENRAAPGLPLGWWRLGADFSSATSGEASPAVRALAGGKPYFLSVGTVEPRKGYPVVLDALEKLWAAGVDATYVVVGGKGWGMRKFERRLARHPESGARLFWFDRASDADLSLLYRNARALILASVAEGFGLPIVEAANYGVPVIATDIPVFREVAGDSALYFDLLDSDSLAERIKAAIAERPAAPVVAPTSWRDSAAQLLGMARDGAFQTRLD